MVDSDDVHVLELSHRVPRFLAIRDKRKDRPYSLFGEKGGPSACARKMEHHMETASFLILGKEKAPADEPPTLLPFLTVPL